MTFGSFMRLNYIYMNPTVECKILIDYIRTHCSGKKTNYCDSCNRAFEQYEWFCISNSNSKCEKSLKSHELKNSNHLKK